MKHIIIAILLFSSCTEKKVNKKVSKTSSSFMHREYRQCNCLDSSGKFIDGVLYEVNEKGELVNPITYYKDRYYFSLYSFNDKYGNIINQSLTSSKHPFVLIDSIEKWFNAKPNTVVIQNWREIRQEEYDLYGKYVTKFIKN